MTHRADEAEERLLIEAARKDRARFGELYERHFEHIYAYISRRVRNRAEVEDLTADVFQRALANLDGFEWRGAPFIAWLLVIAAHAVADRARQIVRQQGNPIEEWNPADHSLEQTEEDARLFRLVRELPADQRRVIQQRFVEQRSIREIALGLGRSEGAVKQLQFRALKNLRARLRDADG